jgi:hypothetical protein
MRLAGVGAALAMAAQIAYLTWPSTQGVVAAGISAMLIWQLWSIRRHLNQHIDMLVLMTAYGGFGMLPLPGAPSCHVSTRAFLMMTGGMLMIGFPPMLLAARCMQEARREHRLVITLAVDVLGMLAGMITAHFVTPIAPVLLHHTSMVFGMIAGMGAARYVLLRVVARAKIVSGFREPSSLHLLPNHHANSR